MKGNNTLTLNQAEMVKAVQHYVDTVMFSKDYKVKVDSVKSSKNQVSSTPSSFDIKLTEVQADDKG